MIFSVGGKDNASFASQNNAPLLELDGIPKRLVSLDVLLPLISTMHNYAKETVNKQHLKDNVSKQKLRH